MPWSEEESGGLVAGLETQGQPLVRPRSADICAASKPRARDTSSHQTTPLGPG